MENTDAFFKLQRASFLLLKDHPFFASLLYYLKFKAAEAVLVVDKKKETWLVVNIKTAATDGEYLFYNPSFIASLKEEDVCGVLAHEVGHIGLLHFSRQGGRERKLWNMAADYEINAALEENNIRLPKGALFDYKFINVIAEVIYEILKQRKEENLPEYKKDATMTLTGGELDGGKTGEIPKEIKSLPTVYIGKKKNRKAAAEWKARVVRALQQAQKAKGNLPAGFERFVDKFVKTKIPWTKVLASMVETVMGEGGRWVYTPPLRKFSWAADKFALPQEKKEEVKAVIAYDTSGSITNKELTYFLSATWDIFSKYSNTKLTIIANDAKVHAVKRVKNKRQFLKAAEGREITRGGGGTDFRPVFNYIKEKKIRPKILVFFTDTYGDFPEKAPKYRVLWVVTSNKEVPFGKRIYVPPEEIIPEGKR